MEPANVWMTAISSHQSKPKMGNGVVDIGKNLARLLIKTVLYVQGELYHCLSSAMMVMLQHQYAIMFIQIHIEIIGQDRVVKNLTWMFARITCKYRPAKF